LNAGHPLERPVAPEDLVATHSGDGDLEAGADRRLGDEVGVDAIDRRLVERPDGVGHALPDLIDADWDLAVAQPDRGVFGEPETGVVRAAMGLGVAQRSELGLVRAAASPNPYDSRDSTHRPKR